MAETAAALVPDGTTASLTPLGMEAAADVEVRTSRPPSKSRILSIAASSSYIDHTRIAEKANLNFQEVENQKLNMDIDHSEADIA